MYADRVSPAFFARRSICSSWLSRAVILTRTVFSEDCSGMRRAIAPFIAGSFARSSSVEGTGSSSPSSSMP